MDVSYRKSSSVKWIHLRSEEVIRCLHMGRVQSCLEDCVKQQKTVFASWFVGTQALRSQV